MCTSASAVRSLKLAAAPLLDPSRGPAQAFGTVEGVSLWDAPIGCVGNDAVGRPESVARLHLAAAVSELVLTTALPETDFDTAVYLIPAGAATSATALGCNDDEKGYSSALTLSNVPAGDYTVVIESIQRRGGHFGLSVTAR